MRPKSFIEELKYKSDIVAYISRYTTLKPTGQSMVGKCPFPDHSDNNPSFTVSPSKQLYNCFSCTHQPTGGDIFTFIMQMDSVSYPEAIQILATYLNLQIPDDGLHQQDEPSYQLQKKILEMNKAAGNFFYKALRSPQGANARKYLAERGMSSDMAKKFKIGYAPGNSTELIDHLLSLGYKQDEIVKAYLGSINSQTGEFYSTFTNRLMFPIIDKQGKLVAFGGRALGNAKAKYLNTSDTPVYKKSKNLYGLNIAKSSKSKNLILVEGYMDVIALHQYGFDSAVAALGATLTPEQARLMSNHATKVLVAFDSDDAGQRATKKAVTALEPAGVQIQILRLEGAKDPDEFLKKFGADQLSYQINHSKSALDFEIHKLLELHNVEDPDGKAAFFDAFIQLMVNTKDSIVRDAYVGQYCSKLEIQKTYVTNRIEAILKSKAQKLKKKQNPSHQTYKTNTMQKNKNQSTLIAEQQIIAYIMKFPEDFKFIDDQIDSTTFVSPLDSDLYELFIRRLEEQKCIEMMSIRDYLTEKHISRLAEITLSISGLNISKTAAQQCIDSINKQSLQKKPDEIKQMDNEEFGDFVKKIIDSKK